MLVFTFPIFFLLATAHINQVAFFDGPCPDGWEAASGLAGRVMIGSGNDFARGDIGGSSEVTLTEANIPAHNHYSFSSQNGASNLGGSNTPCGQASNLGGSPRYTITGCSSTASKGLTSTVGRSERFDVRNEYKVFTSCKFVYSILESNLQTSNDQIATQIVRMRFFDARQDGLQNQIMSLNARQDDLQNPITSLDARQDDLQNQITSLDARQDDLQNPITSLDARQDDLQNQITSLVARQDDLETRILNLDQLTPTSTEQGSNNPSIAEFEDLEARVFNLEQLTSTSNKSNDQESNDSSNAEDFFDVFPQDFVIATALGLVVLLCIYTCCLSYKVHTYRDPVNSMLQMAGSVQMSRARRDPGAASSQRNLW